MVPDTNFENVFKVFAHYGFRKASMADLAEAIGVSRQTLYNRFTSKEDILNWAAMGIIDQKREAALQELAREDRPIRQSLAAAFARWVGDTVGILHNSPHGFEIMDLVGSILQQANLNPHLEFEAALKQYFLKNELCEAEDQADDTVFLLIVASKGLMLKSATPEAFDEGMARILRAVLPKT